MSDYPNLLLTTAAGANDGARGIDLPPPGSADERYFWGIARSVRKVCSRRGFLKVEEGEKHQRISA